MGILLSSSDQLRVAADASVVDVYASWVDVSLDGLYAALGRAVTQLSAPADDRVVSSPPALIMRDVKMLSIHNRGSDLVVVTASHHDGVSSAELARDWLRAGDALIYSEGSGWVRHDCGDALVRLADGRAGAA
jgi:hypothetical protein